MKARGVFSAQRIQAFVAIISRNVFLLVNGIIFAIVVLLSVFGDSQEGIFLGLITLANVVIGSVQEISAWLILERLQLLALPKVTRVAPDGSESTIFAEEIQRGDHLNLKRGDQVPSDGVLVSSHGFEVNEALITGESSVFLKKPGDQVFAGSIITSGVGVLEAEKMFGESRIALMTQSIKKYSFVRSPMQLLINTIIKYIGYVLLIIIIFVAWHDTFTHESMLHVIKEVGALATVLLPQGLVVVVTVFFSYGALYLYRKSILLQEISATEKIGRIKNLCVDKTGTLTDNNLVIEHRSVSPGITEEYADQSVAAYIQGTGDSSQTIEAIKREFSMAYSGSVKDMLSFSSSRQFGAAVVQDSFGERVVVAGAPELLLPHVVKQEEREMLQRAIDTEAKEGKRLICFAQSTSNVLPANLDGLALATIAVFVLKNSLREGVVDTVQFFQERGITIRVISGDHPETVQTIARAAGIANASVVITGAEMEAWSPADFREKAHTYTIFARIKPEQKEKIIDALKEDGFTAMVGDGANDALAIKKADLGIAMFDGAPVTRSLASIVLVKNSFMDLPEGVRLADTIIRYIEMCSSIFFNEVLAAFFLFIMLMVFGHSFPFTPLNISFMNYFTIGFPVSLILYWIVRPVRRHPVRHGKSFLQKMVPFALISALLQAALVAYAFFTSLEYSETGGPTSLVVLAFVAVGVIFFMNLPKLYNGTTTTVQQKEFFALLVVEVVSIAALAAVPFVAVFYNLTMPPVTSLLELLPLVAFYGLVQYGLARYFSLERSA